MSSHLLYIKEKGVWKESNDKTWVCFVVRWQPSSCLWFSSSFAFQSRHCFYLNLRIYRYFCLVLKWSFSIPLSFFGSHRDHDMFMSSCFTWKAITHERGKKTKGRGLRKEGKRKGVETEDKKEEDIVLLKRRELTDWDLFRLFFFFLRANDCLPFSCLDAFLCTFILPFLLLIPSSLDSWSSSSHTPSCFVGNEWDREMRWTRMRRERLHSWSSSQCSHHPKLTWNTKRQRKETLTTKEV